MVTPPTCDLASFSEALEHLYAIEDVSQYSEAVFRALPRLVSSVVLSVDSYNLTSRVSTSHCNTPPPKDWPGWYERVLEVIPTHPAFPYIQKNPGQILAITDCISQREFVQSPLYCDVMRPMRCSYQLVLGLQVPRHVAGITISRDGDFSDSERELLEFVRPHLSQAFIRADLITRLRQQDGSVPPPESLTKLGTTPRESEVLHWMMQGKRDSEIAQIVGCKLRTVQKHVTRILAKLDVETRTAAAQEATRRHRLLCRE